MAKKEYKATPGPVRNGPAGDNPHHGPHVTGAIPEGQYYAVWRYAGPVLVDPTAKETQFECISVGNVYRDAAKVYAEFYALQFNKETRVVEYPLDAWPKVGEIRLLPISIGSKTDEIPG